MIKTLNTAIFLFIFCFILPAKAEMIAHEMNGNIYVEKTTTEELEQLYKKARYGRFRYLPNDEYPAIFLKELPSDFQSITPPKYRNELFIRILAPIALKINEELKNERYLLLRLEQQYQKNKTLSPEDTKTIEGMATKYDVFIRQKQPEVRIPAQISELKKRVEIIPPSIFVAAAAMETNWGSARVANIANSLYKEKVWYTEEGLKPLENADDGYRFRIFKSLTESMRSFAHTFNSDIKYAPVWISREQSALRMGYPIGEDIAYSLSQSSFLPNYVGILDYTTAFYDLFTIDKGRLKKVTLK